MNEEDKWKEKLYVLKLGIQKMAVSVSKNVPPSHRVRETSG